MILANGINQTGRRILIDGLESAVEAGSRVTFWGVKGEFIVTEACNPSGGAGVLKLDRDAPPIHDNALVTIL
jgi:hypothetical protein